MEIQNVLLSEFRLQYLLFNSIFSPILTINENKLKKMSQNTFVLVIGMNQA